MDEEEEEVGSACEVYLQDETCWIADPDYLAHDSGVQGVIAIQFRAGQLWFLDGETRRWTSAEVDTGAKPAAKLRTVS